MGAVATGMKLGAARCLHFHVVWFPRHDGCYLLQCANHFGMCQEGCGQSERCSSRKKHIFYKHQKLFVMHVLQKVVLRCSESWTFFSVARCIQKILNCWRGSTVLCCKSRAKRQGYTEGFNTAFRGGSVMGYALCSLGVLVLWILLTVYRKARSGWQKNDPIEAAVAVL